MAISDINKMMAMYAQPTEFDQNAWKNAFDIANAFTNAENNRTVAEANKVKTEDLKRLYSNALQTDPSSIQSTIAQNNFNTTQYKIGEQGILGQDEMIKALQSYGINPDGTARTIPEAYAAMQADGKNLVNPYALSNVWQAGNQERANKQALYQNILNNAMETEITPTGERVQTGRINAKLLDQRLNQAVISGAMTKADADALRNRAFPVAPNQAVIPVNVLDAVNQVNSMLLPEKTSIQPTPVSQQISKQDVPTPLLTPEQQRQQLADNLKAWQDGGAEAYWRNYFQGVKNDGIARDRAMAEAMGMNNKPYLPYYLQR